jgi:hypothetical protein
VPTTPDTAKIAFTDEGLDRLLDLLFAEQSAAGKGELPAVDRTVEHLELTNFGRMLLWASDFSFG